LGARHPRGSYVIYGCNDSTLNRGGVRMGIADFYAVVEGFDEVTDWLVIDTTELGARDEGALLCFLVLAPWASLQDVEPSLRKALRVELSPRHVSDRFIVVDAIPHPQRQEVRSAVKRILTGTPVEQAVSRDALTNPESLVSYLEFAAALSTRGANVI
jgi:acetoacetyl-CoA synthetase